MKAKVKLRGDLFKQGDARQVCITVGELRAAFEKEYHAREAEVFEHCKRDIVAQLMATCMVELSQEFGFGRKRLQRFKRGTEALFVAMARDGILGRAFTPQNCVDVMRERYGIDVDAREEV